MAEQRAHFALFSYPSNPLDFGLATKLAGVEPTTIHHVGEPRKGAKWEYDLWRYYPGGNDLTAQINHALAFIKPESPFAEYARSVEAFVRVTAQTKGSQRFSISRNDVERLHATAAVLDAALFWPDSQIEDDYADASVQLAFEVVGETRLKTEVETALGETVEYLEERIAAFAAEALRSCTPIDGPRTLTISLVEHGTYHGSFNIHLGRITVAALAALKAEIVIALAYQEP